MTECQCGHDTETHHDNLGRCEGQCHDPEYGQFSCLCPYFMEEKL